MTARRRSLVAALAALVLAAGPSGIACSGSDVAPDGAASDGGGDDASGGEAGAEATGAADWILAFDPAAPAAGTVDPSLLGQYDLSGALFDYASVPGLSDAMKAVGFSEWRVGVGRWESGTQLLPTLTDGTPCPANGLPAAAFAPAGTTDLDLIAARDWFTDDGQPVALAMTDDDARYDLRYARRALDEAVALGARPYVDVDLVPRALSSNRTPSRTTAVIPVACSWTWTNRVSNAAPADPAVYAAAVAGLVKRVVEGSGGEPPRVAPYWEFWNEEELPYAWDPASDDAKHTKWFDTAAMTMVRLDAWRRGAASAAAKSTKFGIGSFARGETAAAVIAALDGASVQVPLDFVSFHAYSNDPLEIVAAVSKVAAARDASSRYRNLELSLSEWGPDLGPGTLDPRTMDPAILVATVIALGAGAGLGHAHHTFFWDFYDGLAWGMLDHSVTPKPLYHAYELLAGVVAGGGDRLAVTGGPAATEGAVLVARDRGGVVRALVVNASNAPKSVRVDLPGRPGASVSAKVFDDPHGAVRTLGASGPVLMLAPRSIALLAP